MKNVQPAESSLLDTSWWVHSLKMVSKGHKTATDAARLFKIHPATISRLLARVYAE